MACCFHSEGFQNRFHTADRWVDTVYVLELFSPETRTHLADLAYRFEVMLNLVPPTTSYKYMLHVKINRTCNIFSSQTLNEYTCIRTLIIHTPSHRPMQPYFVGFYLYIGDTSTFVWMQLLTMMSY